MIEKEYINWLVDIKSKIRSSQLKAVMAVNSALIEFYWELGKIVSEKENIWGNKLIEQVSKDLKDEFPEMKGLSVTNIKYCRLFYNYFSIRPQAGDLIPEIRPQAGDEFQEQSAPNLQLIDKELNIVNFKKIFLLPWGHIKLIIDKIKDKKISQFYITETLENNWGRDALALQIKSNLHLRKGNAISNFKNTLPEGFSDLAQQTLKDPYVFDFLSMTENYKERDLENQLIQHISKFILELGKGFAFVGQQYNIEIAGKDYFIDLLFYHIKLKCYVVIDLKNTEFKPEYTGKMNFYLSAIDTLLKDENDNPTIGILLCRDKNNIEAEFALRGINKPIGITEFELTQILPENLKSSLPSIEELEEELKKYEE
jgi:predicted nuclease of restriction endonuclease-like (RecB) superfamily